MNNSKCIYGRFTQNLIAQSDMIHIVKSNCRRDI